MKEGIFMKGKFVKGEYLEHIIPIVQNELDLVIEGIKDPKNDNKKTQKWLCNNANILSTIISYLKK